MLFNSCQYLESISILCGGDYLNDKDLFEIVARNSSENFYELKLCYYLIKPELLPEALESFFTKWTNRIPQKSLSLVITNYDTNSLDTNDENMEIVKKYTKLGVIKKFKVTDFNDEFY